MKNIRLWLRFDGTDFHGYQIQKNGVSVQEVIEEAIHTITGEKVSLIGCSRTDAGVHAKMYCANFSSDTRIPMDKLPLALNTALPFSVRVYKAETVKDTFHATFSAVEKTYEYHIDTGKIMDPFETRYTWYFTYDIDVAAMERAAEKLIGTHDFSAFMAVGGQTKTTVRTIRKLTVKKDGDKITVRVTADGFLYNMVRIIVGTLVYCGIGKLTEQDVERLLIEKDRKEAGITAPPQGLFLVSVVYDE